MGTSTVAPVTNNVCAMCPRILTVKVKIEIGYICPPCYRTVMSAGK